MKAIPAAIDLIGRSALITGAGAELGIGFAAARALGDLGARIVVTSTTDRIEQRVAELQAAGIAASGFVADLTNEREVNALLEFAGHVDICVNNAGMVSVGEPGETGDAQSLSLATWRAGMTRNLDTAFMVSRAVVGPMIEAGWGRIVNVSSVTGPVVAMRGQAVYAAAKAGMVGLTRAMAVDSARQGVTVNAVAPGWIATASLGPQEAAEGAICPVGRCGNPDEIASAIAWLASPGAGYITGQVIVVDGGNSISEEHLNN
jgi:3-oxoacyl-[acyl-carrier protein] reductase